MCAMLRGHRAAPLTCIKRRAGASREHAAMHYHYFTIEQRDALAQAMRARAAEPAIRAALERLHTPEYGVCESCGADIAFSRLSADPALRRCPACQGAAR